MAGGSVRLDSRVRVRFGVEGIRPAARGAGLVALLLQPGRRGRPVDHRGGGRRDAGRPQASQRGLVPARRPWRIDRRDSRGALLVCTASLLDMKSVASRWLALAEVALIAAGVAVYLAMPHEINSDGLIRLEKTRYLARGQIIDAPTGLLMSALALPLYHCGDVVAVLNTLVFFAGLAAMALLLRRYVQPALFRRLVLLLLAASMFGHHTQLFFGEVLTAMFTAVGLVLVVVGQPVSGFALLILGAVNTPAALP